jgi:hypothetical protein
MTALSRGANDANWWLVSRKKRVLVRAPMSKSFLNRSAAGAVFAALALVACGGDSNQPDPYYGSIFASDFTNPAALDAKFLAANTKAACTTNPAYAFTPFASPCYPLQQGYANGKVVWFYNFYGAGTRYSALTTTTIVLPAPFSTTLADPYPLPVGGGGAHVDVFPHSCSPKAFDPVAQPYSDASQFPIFNNLPFALSTNQGLDGAIALPFVATYGVTIGAGQTETCNDLKDARSISDASNPGAGKFGATRTAQPTSYQLWATIDVTTPVQGDPAAHQSFPNAVNPSYGPQFGWYEGLLLRYLDGGPIPTKTVTNSDGTTSKEFVAMEGIIVDPASSGFSSATTNKVILLPAAPGDDAYSPIVNLHDYKLQTGQSIGSVTSICQPSDPHPCPITSADFNKATAAPFFTIFIAAPPQTPVTQ